MFCGGLREGGADDWAGDAVVCGDAECVSGVVVDEAEDLGVGAVGEVPVGEVGLPGFVGEGRFEADIGGAGTFLRLGFDESCGAEMSPDRGGRDGDVVVVGQVPGDGVGAGIEASFEELGAQLHDQGDRGWADAGGAVFRSA